MSAGKSFCQLFLGPRLKKAFVLPVLLSLADSSNPSVFSIFSKLLKLLVLIALSIFSFSKLVLKIVINILLFY